jgi:threonine dehydrogenase-like Zn-dependent dehydrogenase
MKANSPQLWDEIWKGSPPPAEDRYAFAKEEHSIRWRRMKGVACQEFGSFAGLKVIEIGAGLGTCAALMARHGASVTILDYSDEALRRAREFFDRINLPAEFIKQDALALPAEQIGVYNISMSFGLSEHFRGPARVAINKAHVDVLKAGGLTFISVPNRFCPPYRLFKVVAQAVGKWSFGEEYPYSRGELLSMGRAVGLNHLRVFGGSLPSSFDFVNPFKASALVQRVLRLSSTQDISRLRPEKGTFLDGYLSYALVLSGKKQ